MLNKVILIGHVGKVNSNVTKNGDSIVLFSIITCESYKDKTTNEWKEKSEWHQIISFGKCAEHIKEKFVVGDLLYLEGKYHTHKWQDKDGIDRYSVKIRVQENPKLLPRFYKHHTETVYLPIKFPVYPVNNSLKN